jgi:pilus assembly protein Flp/PilA
MKNALKSLCIETPAMLQSKLFAIKSQKGVAMLEYALLAALIAVVAIVGLENLGPAISDAFESIGDTINDAF